MAVDFKKLGKKIAAKKADKTSKASTKAPAAKAKGGDGKYDDSNRFVLFVNDKDGNENRPDFTGKATIVLSSDYKAGEQIEVRLAAWNQTSEKIGEYLSGKVSEPQAE